MAKSEITEYTTPQEVAEMIADNIRAILSKHFEDCERDSVPDPKEEPSMAQLYVTDIDDINKLYHEVTKKYGIPIDVIIDPLIQIQCPYCGERIGEKYDGSDMSLEEKKKAFEEAAQHILKCSVSPRSIKQALTRMIDILDASDSAIPIFEHLIKQQDQIMVLNKAMGIAKKNHKLSRSKRPEHGDNKECPSCKRAYMEKNGDNTWRCPNCLHWEREYPNVYKDAQVGDFVAVKVLGGNLHIVPIETIKDNKIYAGNSCFICDGLGNGLGDGIYIKRLIPKESAEWAWEMMVRGHKVVRYDFLESGFYWTVKDGICEGHGGATGEKNKEGWMEHRVEYGWTIWSEALDRRRKTSIKEKQ